MIRRIIRIPRAHFRETLGRRTISDRGQVADLLGQAFRRHGCNPSSSQPARWGFGVIARRLRQAGSQVLHAIEAIHLGSSDPLVAQAISALLPEDLRLDRALPGWELDLRYAEILSYPPLPTGLEALNGYCLSPIRVSRRRANGDYEDVVELIADYSECLNQTMQRRFERPFHLQLLPDRLYVRSRGGQLSAGFAIKTRPNGKAIVKRGLVLPFTLVGPSEDLQDAWYSGLGRTTALGFGMLELQA